MLRKSSKTIKYRIEKKVTKFYSFIERNLISLFVKIFINSKARKLPSSISGYYNFATNDEFLKIIVRQEIFFLQEKNNIAKISQNFPDLRKVIPQYQYKNYFNNSFLMASSSKMNAILKEEEYIAAENFLNAFRIYGKIGRIKLDNMEFVKKGLEIIKNIGDKDLYENFLAQLNYILEEKIYRVGVCHGDFHSKNFLQKNGKNYLIDFDCFRDNSIQELDAIYFIVQKIIDHDPGIWSHEAISIFEEQVSKKITYSSFLQKFLDLNDISSLKLVYFLDRIGQDSKYLQVKATFSPAVIEIIYQIQKDFTDDSKYYS